MENKIICYLMLFCLIISIKLPAQPVNSDTLQKIALNFYLSDNSNLKNNEVKILSKETIKSDAGIPLYSIFIFSPKGFVIIAEQKNVFPILGYSFDNNYVNDTNNFNFKYWMNNYKKQINIAIQNNKVVTNKINEAWNYFQNIKSNNIKEKTIAPLLTSTWNQNNYYNELCPADAAGPNGHTYAGCVATAMGQIMFYYRWPITGFGSYTYEHPIYGTISADFQNTTYLWDAMANNITFSNLEVAKLLFHIGVSVDMDYGPNGSGMWNHKAAYSYRNYFKYCPETRYIYRDSTTLSWDSLIITNLNNNKPLYYAGWEDTTFTSGHAFVCDGYQSNTFFHFNWGWGGSNDGFYYLAQLNPSGYNFNFCQELIVDIYPDTVNYIYPLNCSGYTEINSSNGTFTDGSSIKQYAKGSNCSWLINPDCGVKIKLLFDKYDIATGDTINIYDGVNEQSPLLESYNNTNFPVTTENSSPTLIGASTKNIYLTFTSDSINEAEGFKSSYSVNYCLSDTIYDLSGTVSDGSGPCDYNVATNCRWIIKPADAQSVTLNFTEFNLATDNVGDYVKVYKNNFLASNVITTYNYLTPPLQPLTVQAPIVGIRFVTNSLTQASGWAFDYSTTITNILESESHPNNAFIYPNPFTNDATISFYSDKLQNANVSIVDVTGKNINNVQLKLIEGINNIKISVLSTELTAGYYFVKIKLDNTEYSKKLICLPLK